MKKSKQITLLYFCAYDEDENAFSLKPYFKKPIGEALEKLAAEHYGNYFQFRHIERHHQRIIGRLCKIRRVDKPMIGTLDSDKEKEISDDVIESAVFLYDVEKELLLVEKKPEVSASIGAVFSRLFIHLQERHCYGSGCDIFNNAYIQPELTDDVLEKICQKKAFVQKISYRLRQDSQLILKTATDEDLNYSKGEKSLIPKKLDVEVIGQGVSENIIKKAIDAMSNKQIEDAGFRTDEETIWLSRHQKNIPILNPEEHEGDTLEIKRDRLYKSLLDVEII